MKLLQIAITEDSQDDLHRLTECLKQAGQEIGLTIKTTIFHEGLSFLDEYKPIYDIVFLDIDMPYKNGIDIAKELRLKDKDVIIAFVTNLAQMAVKGYEVDAVDFIIKPVEYSHFIYRFRKMVEKSLKGKEESLLLTNGKEKNRVKYDDIIYITVSHHSLIFHTIKEEIRVPGSMSKLKNDFHDSFCLCNSGTMVNLNHISSIKGDFLSTSTGDVLPISRSHYKDLVNQFTLFMGEN